MRMVPRAKLVYREYIQGFKRQRKQFTDNKDEKGGGVRNRKIRGGRGEVPLTKSHSVPKAGIPASLHPC